MVDCNFIVDSTNGNGLGIRNLKGQGVANIFMNTSATPGKGSNGVLNPNPAAGTIIVQFADNFQRLYCGWSGIGAPLSGTPLGVTSGLTVGKTYVIVSVGTSTSADWLALGVQPGITPAVGVSFVAIATGAGAGTGSVELTVASGIDHIELDGDPNTTLAPIPVGGSPHVGGFIYMKTYLSSTVTAPTNGTVISLVSYFSQSTVQVAGE